MRVRSRTVGVAASKPVALSAGQASCCPALGRLSHYTQSSLEAVAQVEAAVVGAGGLQVQAAPLCV